MKRVLILCLSVGALFPALGGCQKKGDAAESTAEATVRVRARLPEKRLFHETVTAEGQWRSSTEVVLSAPFSALVDSVAVQLGDRVARGQLLCRLVSREAQAALRGATLLGAEAHDAAGRREADRALALARRELNRVPLTAPRSGLVVRMIASAGGEVAESGEILALVPQDALVFEAHVRASAASLVRVGQAATIQEEGRPLRHAAIQRILPIAGASDQSTLVWLRPQEDGGFPEIDRYGTAVVEVGAPSEAPAVPDSAVVQDDLTGETRIALIREGRAIWTRASLGRKVPGWHELLAPSLVPGEYVITAGHRGLPDSTRVQVAS